MSTRTNKTKAPRPSTKKDPDLYDPVGMAGKQAGIIEELQPANTTSPRQKDRARTKRS